MRRSLLIIACVGLLLTGCWNRVEVNDLGVVTALAVDSGVEHPVRVILYLSRATGGASRQQAGGDPTWVVARESANLAEALRLISMASPRRITLHHVKLILIGEEYARSSIADLIDFVARNPQVRLNAILMVAQGRAQDLVEVQPQLETQQTEALFELIEAQGGLRNRLKEFLVARTSLTHSGWMYMAHTRERPARQPNSSAVASELFGVGYFLRDSLVAVAGPQETMLLTWLLGSAREGVISVPCPDAPDKSLSVALQQSSSRIVPTWRGSMLSFKVHVSGISDLRRSECDTETLDDTQRAELERSLGNAVRTEMKALIKRFQTLGIDPVGFGKRVQLAAPDYWRPISTDWIKVWTGTPVEVTADVLISRTGLLIRPGNKTDVELRRR